MSTEDRVSFLRHSGWISPDDLSETITVIGCGAVGSHAALLAAKMGATKFELWDADIVESHNLSNQAFDVEHLGQPKVEALKHVLQRFNPEVDVVIHDEFFTKETASFPGGPIVLAVDSMSARKAIVGLSRNNMDVSQIFEIRLGFDFGIVNIVDNLDEDSLNNFLATIKDDKDVEEGPCNQRMCTTLVYNTVSILVQQLCRYYVADKQNKDFVAPFRYFVVFDNDLGSTEVIPMGDEEWEAMTENPDNNSPESTDSSTDSTVDEPVAAL